MKEKKVLFVATVANHIRGFHIPYLKMFKEHGYKTYVAANWNLKDEDKLDYCDEFIQIPIERKPLSWKNIKAITELKNIIENEKFDIVHCHTPMGGVVARLAAKSARKKYKTRVIYTAHGFHFYKGAPLKNWVIFYPIEKYLAMYTDTLITINQEDYKFAQKEFMSRCKDIEFVHGVGVDCERFVSPISDDIINEYKKQLKIADKDYVLITVGELNDNKNQSMSIEAMKDIVNLNKNYKFLIVGKGVLKDKYQRMIEEFHLQDNVMILGYRRDIEYLMKISNLAISTSKREGLPVNVIEALISGLPVIATNCRGNRDLVMPEYLVPINDINALKDKILNLGDYKKIDTRSYELENVKKEYEKIYFK